MPTIKGMKGGLFGKKPEPLHASEATVQASIRDFLNRLGIYNDRLNSGMVNALSEYTKKDGTKVRRQQWIHLCKKGTPDLYFLFSGKMHYTETKRIGKRATPEQITRHKELRRAGAIVWEADSLDRFTEQFYNQYPLLKKIL